MESENPTENLQPNDVSQTKKLNLVERFKAKYNWDSLTPKKKAYTLIFGAMTKGEIFMLILLITFVLFISWSYSHDIAAYKTVYENPCKYCVDCTQKDATGWLTGDGNSTVPSIDGIKKVYLPE